MQRTNLRNWAKMAGPTEIDWVCKRAGVKRHYFQRLYRGQVKNPGINTARTVVASINYFNSLNTRLPGFELPNVTLDDI